MKINIKNQGYYQDHINQGDVITCVSPYATIPDEAFIITDEQLVNIATGERMVLQGDSPEELLNFVKSEHCYGFAYNYYSNKNIVLDITCKTLPLATTHDPDPNI